MGWLLAYEFLREQDQPNVEQGPSRLFAQTLADGRFSRCTAQKGAQWLRGLPLTEGDEGWLDDLEAAFVDHNYSYRQLLKAIVTSPMYRRAR